MNMRKDKVSEMIFIIDAGPRMKYLLKEMDAWSRILWNA